MIAALTGRHSWMSLRCFPEGKPPVVVGGLCTIRKHSPDLDVAKKIENTYPLTNSIINEGSHFHLHLLENREWFKGFEERSE
ncbi:MAG: hypothetical protein SV375_20005 [Thermodesulfobacteriota bacterium]|nr:hypothetical protein [Thermodesulfobacteriota bacterium]